MALTLHSRLPRQLLAVLVTIAAIAGAIAVLLPILSDSQRREAEYRLKLSPAFAAAPQRTDALAAGPVANAQNAKGLEEVLAGGAPHAPPPVPLAAISSFTATIELTPRLSVGTDEPESIYQASFVADLIASHPDGKGGEARIELPLPPEIISLTELNLTIGDKSQDRVLVEGDHLVWRGPLAGLVDTPVKVRYNAVGKGFFRLQTPPGGIVDVFKVDLSMHGSGVRMLELSLQPTKVAHTAGATTYTWDYKRLMFGRPIALDVLGIAPVDRLGRLATHGPISVALFGVLAALVIGVVRPERLTVWTTLFLLGAFAAAYPLMYFAQEFVPIRTAIVGSAALVLVIIAVRAVALLGWRVAAVGLVAPATGAIAAALFASLLPATQGLVLTLESLVFFVAAMGLAPRFRLWLPDSPPAIPMTAVTA